ncbi:MAG: hypothetical protein LYZ66_05950 [Nitrososphaerales archaeon]|nr:hypothetical protein [Nitrososphaerales archaeon]
MSFYERKIASFGALIREAGVMDADSGIRLVGRYSGRRCYAFVTRFGSRYTVMIYGIQRRKGGPPGRRLESEEAEGLEGLRTLLKRLVSRRVEAYAY